MNKSPNNASFDDTNNIPTAWIYGTLNDFIHRMTGGVSTKKSDYTNTGLLVLNKGDIKQFGIISIKDRPNKVSKSFSENHKKKVIVNGDIVATLRDLSNKADFLGLVSEYAHSQKALITQGMYKLKTFNEENRKFITYYSNSPLYRRQVKQNKVGATQVHLRNEQFLNLNIPLPPLAEQKEIAARLDQLLAQIDNIKARLDAIPAILKRFRQSVLAAAVSGKLTEEWRGIHVFFQSKDIIKSCIKKDKKTQSLTEKPINPSELMFTIPDSWTWVRLCNIAEIMSGIAKSSNTKGELIELPYLRVANVQRGYLDLNEVKHIMAPPQKATKLYLQKNDILFNEGGDLDKLGRGWIWEDQIKNCIHQNHVFRARLYSKECEAKYISYYGNSAGRDYFIREGSQTINLANINKTSLSLLPIPLPPKEEQTEIVRRVDQLFAFADQVENRVTEARKRVDQLTQSILAKAFRGDLTADWRDQHPELITGDNSAQALLKQIRNARKAAASPKKPATRKRKKPKTGDKETAG